MAGSSLRCARSPVAPKIVKMVGSLAPPTRRPVRRGFSAALAGTAASVERRAALRAPPRAGLRGTARLLPGQAAGDRVEQGVERLRERPDAVELELSGDVREVDPGVRQLLEHRALL